MPTTIPIAFVRTESLMVPGTMRPWQSTGRWRRRSGNWPAIAGSGQRESSLIRSRGADPIWPEDLEPTFRDQQFAIARTSAEYGEHPEVKEVEALFLDMIASARRFIYAENQYFTSPKIAHAILQRMRGSDPPEIIFVNPIRAEGWLEQVAMDAARVRLRRLIGREDPGNRFRIYSPVTDGGADIYVHAKIMIVDDRILRVGSANMNNRSLGLDSECDLAVQAEDEATEAVIAGVRTRLMAEHLGVTEEEVRTLFSRTGSLIGTIEALQGEGRTLKTARA